MKQVVSKQRLKSLHQKFSALDNSVVSAFCNSFTNVQWIADYKDNDDEFCGIDLQLTANTKTKKQTYDIEIKSRITLTDFSIAKDCFFEWEKWYSLNQWDNDKKLYIVIYPNCNKIAIWNVCKELFKKSKKDYVEMKRNTCNSNQTKSKLVYKFKLSDAQVFNFDLTNYKEKYNALYKQATQNY